MQDESNMLWWLMKHSNHIDVVRLDRVQSLFRLLKDGLSLLKVVLAVNFHLLSLHCMGVRNLFFHLDLALLRQDLLFRFLVQLEHQLLRGAFHLLQLGLLIVDALLQVDDLLVLSRELLNAGLIALPLIVEDVPLLVEQRLKYAHEVKEAGRRHVSLPTCLGQECLAQFGGFHVVDLRHIDYPLL